MFAMQAREVVRRAAAPMRRAHTVPQTLGIAPTTRRRWRNGMIQHMASISQMGAARDGGRARAVASRTVGPMGVRRRTRASNNDPFNMCARCMPQHMNCFIMVRALGVASHDPCQHVLRNACRAHTTSV